MIYLVTGNPGSGKTLYAVSTLVKSLLADKLTGEDGQVVERRLVVDGVPDLLLPHELMAPVVKTADARGNDKLTAEGFSLLNWHEWCKPGDVIFVDEVQRIWRPRGMGVTPPASVEALETHRHKGVDFVVVTQNPMLLDSNVRRLVNRHQHVRRIMGWAKAVIYDWDSCASSLNLKSATAKSYFKYPKDAFKLYKSSELHTKQKQKIPAWIAIPVLGLAGGLFLAPKAFSTLSGVASGKGVTAAAPVPSASAPVLPGAIAAAAPLLAASAPGLAVSFPPVAGCIVVKGRCGCFDVQGLPVKVERDFCAEQSGEGRDKPVEFADSPTLREPSEAERDTLAFVFLKK